MLSAIILEDEILAQERLKLLLKDNKVAVLETFKSASSALIWLEGHVTDIIFVDIGLPEINGIEFVRQLRQKKISAASVIFSTAYDNFAVEAFTLNATDYLLKPIRAKRLKEALNKIPNYQQEKENGFHFFKIQLKKNLLKIPWQKVVYLQAEDKSVFLFTVQQEIYELPYSLTYWENQLRDKAIRIHRNTLVIKPMLEALVKREINNHLKWHAKIANSDLLLPISRRQLSQVQQQFYETATP
ncbi:MAG: LytTR family DNA-binding domain-containing protein [Neisseriaceae bacterium]